MEEKNINEILDNLEWTLRARLSHLEIANINPVELHNVIDNIIVDEIRKIKVSTF